MIESGNVMSAAVCHDCMYLYREVLVGYSVQIVVKEYGSRQVSRSHDSSSLCVCIRCSGIWIPVDTLLQNVQQKTNKSHLF